MRWDQKPDCLETRSEWKLGVMELLLLFKLVILSIYVGEEEKAVNRKTKEIH